MGIQINGSTDRITAIDGTIDFVSNIGNIGLITASNYVLQDAITIGAGSTIIKTVNGKLGIGTATPNSAIQINHVSPKIILEDNDNGADISIHNVGGAAVISAASAITFQTSDTSEKLRIDSNGKIGIGDDDPDGNKLLIRHSSTVGTNKGHIMLTGDGATNGEGPQILFSESGSNSSYAGAYVGHIREGSNSQGSLVFGTRNTSGDASTVPAERIRIYSTGQILYSAASGDNIFTSKRTNSAGSNGNYFFHLKAQASGGTNVGALGFHRDTNTDDSRFVVHTRNTGGSLQERLRITSVGRVGVGTITPHTSYRFDIRHTSDSILHLGQNNNTLAGMGNDSWNALSFQGTNCELGLYKDGSGNFSYIMGTYQGGTAIPIIFRTGNRVERLRIDENGQVLCCSDESFGSTGVASGNASMMVRGDSGAWALKLLCRHNQNDYSYLGFASQDNSENLAEIYVSRTAANTATMVFGVRNSGANIEAIRIKNNGYIGINDTNPDGRVHITDSGENNIYIEGNTSTLGSRIMLINRNTTANSYNQLEFCDAGGQGTSAIRGINVDNASNEGGLEFYCRPNGGNPTKWFTMTPTGELVGYTGTGKMAFNNCKYYQWGGTAASSATFSVNVPVYANGNIYKITAMYAHHSGAYACYREGTYGAYSGHSGMQITDDTVSNHTSSNSGSWTITRGSAGQPVVITKTAGTYNGHGYWFIHVLAGT